MTRQRLHVAMLVSAVLVGACSHANNGAASDVPAASTTSVTVPVVTSEALRGTSTTIPATTTRRAMIVSAEGVGETRFGEPASAVVPFLVRALGEPSVTHEDTSEGCRRRSLTFGADEFVVDFEYRGDDTDPVFVGYSYSHSRLGVRSSVLDVETDQHVKVGLSDEQVRMRYPEAKRYEVPLGNGVTHINFDVHMAASTLIIVLAGDSVEGFYGFAAHINPCGD